VIVDIAGRNGSSGSATVDGDHIFVEVPLADTLGDSYRVTATATYRVLGKARTVVREFAEGQ
jgi:hypothetical protein